MKKETTITEDSRYVIMRVIGKSAILLCKFAKDNTNLSLRACRNLVTGNIATGLCEMDLELEITVDKAIRLKEELMLANATISVDITICRKQITITNEPLYKIESYDQHCVIK